jgi:hypothetical protein
MSDVKLMTEEEIKKGYAENNMDVVNGVLRGEIKRAPEGYQPEAQPIEAPKVEDNKPVETVIPATTVEQPKEDKPIEPIIDEREVELERLRKYAETIEAQKREEVEQLLKEKAAAESKIEEERKARLEFERKLREQEERKILAETSPKSSENVDEDDPYASDYSKKTRQEVKNLEKTIEELKKTSPIANDPELKSALNDLKVYKEQIEQDKKQKAIEEQKKKTEEARNKLFAEIEGFQGKHEDLRTNIDVRRLNDEYLKFRENMRWLMKPKNDRELDRSLNQFFDAATGEQLRQKATAAGIKPPEDYEKFQKLAELVDLKNGLEVNPITGDIQEIKDENGNRVRYRSIEEAYRVKHFYEDLNKARREATLDIKNKIEKLNERAITLDNKTTAATGTTMSKEDAIKYISTITPDVYQKDPQKHSVIKEAYALLGMAPPKYRGRI